MLSFVTTICNQQLIQGLVCYNFQINRKMFSIHMLSLTIPICRPQIRFQRILPVVDIPDKNKI